MVNLNLSNFPVCLGIYLDTYKFYLRAMFHEILVEYNDTNRGSSEDNFFNTAHDQAKVILTYWQHVKM